MTKIIQQMHGMQLTEKVQWQVSKNAIETIH